MAKKPRLPHPTAAANRLRHAIDSGMTGEKVNYPDLAAAPLGTDDEAAGVTPSMTQSDIPADMIRTPRRQRSRVLESEGERSVKFILLGFIIVFAVVVIWIVVSHNG